MRVLILIFLALSLQTYSYSQSEREFGMPEGDTVYVMKMYWMCFLYSGENRTHDSLAASKIQEAHLNRINELANEGIIQIAGPFGHDGDLKGILIYDLNTKEEAEKYANSDPAVMAGRLRYEIYPWWTAKGSTLK